MESVSIDDLPATETSDSTSLEVDGFQQIDPNYVAAERIGGAIFACFFLAASVAGAVSLWFFVPWVWVAVLAAIACIALNVGLLLVVFLWPPVEYRHIFWRLDEESLEVRRGVVWKHQISIPLGRVQHADVSQGPLQRRFQLSSLTVHTAASRFPSITLEGLNYQVALDLRDKLIQQCRQDDSL